ncbi:hypothetical protein K443DRAFT_51347, partial [Laccaria amethystina LaAM-08-1]
SPAVNGTISSRDKLSTSMQCSHHCTIFLLLKRTLDTWEQLKSPLAEQSLPKGSKRGFFSAYPLGMPQSKRPNSLSLTGKTNSENTGSTSKVISLPKSPLLTAESSFMTLQSEMRSGVGRTPYSPTHIDSPGSTLPLLCPMESNLVTPEHLQSGQAVKQARPKYATDSTLSMDAETQPTIAVSNTLAKNVNALVTEKNNVIAKRELAHELCPKYLRYNLWEGGSHFLPSSADWTEAASPLPPVPTSELANPIVTKTIKENPHLFDIVTPIFVDRFENLLESHPNQPFVKSVCRGLREGFWPWADTHFGEYPDTLDLSLPEPTDEWEAQFLQDQRDHEVFKGRFSQPFGTKLLPGMYCMPIFVVPKIRNSPDLRMVTHQSTGNFSLNSMIPHEEIIGYPLNNLQHLGEFLLSMHEQMPNSPHILFKSDIAEAYHLLPIHPYWQIKQVNRIGNDLHVDRNNTFGGHASGCNWITFMALVSWIAKKKRNIELLGTYSDDSFGPDLSDNLTFYPPYWKFMPSNQVKLLQLWDEINLPHKESKQLFGPTLTIIGIEVNANALSMTMTPNAISELITAINDFTTTKRRFTLCEWQRLAGWINWSLNVFPLLRPALNNFYAKISDKSAPNKYICVNNAIRADLQWAITHLKHDNRIRLLHQIRWDPSSADITLYCDACLEGMGFWFPDKCISYYSPVPESTMEEHIFYYEALCVLSAIHHATDFLCAP